MKNIILQLRSLMAGVITLIFAMSVVAFGVMSWTDAQAQSVVDTVHNLSSSGTGPNTNSATADVCVFCHTPHGANIDAAVPLWNKNLTDPGLYTTYDSLGTTSNDGEITDVGSVSIACLSCHDGTQAMDSMINEPGSGFETGDYATTWTGVGTLAAPSAAFIGLDLSDDHPIGVQYGGGGITNVNSAGPTNDEDFIATATDTINGNLVWWVDTTGGTAAQREKTDMVLYTRSDANIDAGAPQPFVECASCHDPHTDVNPTFLRVSNNGSAVCLSCHIK